MDKKPESKSPAEIYLFAADSHKTLARTVMREKDGRLTATFPLTDATQVYGDRSVARYSAIGDERLGAKYTFGVKTNIGFKNETFLSDDHIGLTKNPHFSNNLLHILLEKAPPSRER